jgi:hypothetical protein
MKRVVEGKWSGSVVSVFGFQGSLQHCAVGNTHRLRSVGVLNLDHCAGGKTPRLRCATLGDLALWGGEEEKNASDSGGLQINIWNKMFLVWEKCFLGYIWIFRK